jgi:hypothetical protein
VTSISAASHLTPPVAEQQVSNCLHCPYSLCFLSVSPILRNAHKHLHRYVVHNGSCFYFSTQCLQFRLAYRLWLILVDIKEHNCTFRPLLPPQTPPVPEHILHQYIHSLPPPSSFPFVQECASDSPEFQESDNQSRSQTPATRVTQTPSKTKSSKSANIISICKVPCNFLRPGRRKYSSLLDEEKRFWNRVLWR